MFLTSAGSSQPWLVSGLRSDSASVIVQLKGAEMNLTNIPASATI
jgi:hypothetical protein